MKCEKCSGKLRVIDSVNSPDNVIYRKRKCVNCGFIFYTIEFDVEYSDIKKEWNKYYRK